MEIKETKKENKQGYTTATKTVIKTNPSDGFVNYADVMPATKAPETYQKHKGYTISGTYVIKDPKITRPFSIIFTAILIIIGIWFLFFDYLVVKIFGVALILLSVYFFIYQQKCINKIAREMKNEKNS